MYTRGCYVRSDGEVIPPPVMLQSLVEHVGRWRDAVGRHGMAILEAGQLPSGLAGFHLERCVSMAFDCCQSLSHQYLVPLPEWLLCAAGAAMFPADLRSFPPEATRVMLTRLTPRPYAIRHATSDDLAACVALEAAAVDDRALRTPEAVVAKRLKERSRFNFALVAGGAVRGVVYFQYVDDIPALLAATWAGRDRCAIPDNGATHVQILDVFAEAASPDYAADLRDFVLSFARVLPRKVEEVCCFARATRFAESEEEDFEDYCLTANGANDPGLAFHAEGGATLRTVVPGFHPEDEANGGNGVYLTYAVNPRSASAPRP